MLEHPDHRPNLLYRKTGSAMSDGTRKPISKRLRYEILRRDDHQCRYCGATAPHTPLTVTNKWKYFCGCCWGRIRESQDQAQRIMSRWEAEA